MISRLYLPLFYIIIAIPPHEYLTINTNALASLSLSHNSGVNISFPFHTYNIFTVTVYPYLSLSLSPSSNALLGFFYVSTTILSCCVCCCCFSWEKTKTEKITMAGRVLWCLRFPTVFVAVYCHHINSLSTSLCET